MDDIELTHPSDYGPGTVETFQILLRIHTTRDNAPIVDYDSLLDCLLELLRRQKEKCEKSVQSGDTAWPLPIDRES